MKQHCSHIDLINVYQTFRDWGYSIQGKIHTEGDMVVICINPDTFDKHQIEYLAANGCHPNKVRDDEFIMSFPPAWRALKKLKDVKEKLELIKDTCCYSSVALDIFEIDEMILQLEETYNSLKG